MKNKTANASTTLEVSTSEGNNALTVVKKKLSVAEKIDHIMAFEALASKHEYLKEVKTNLEKFGSGDDGFGGAKVTMTCNYTDVKVSNPAIMEEVTKLLRVRIKEAVIKVEKEIEEFSL
jgi:hypothetical protein